MLFPVKLLGFIVRAVELKQLVFTFFEIINQLVRAEIIFSRRRFYCRNPLGEPCFAFLGSLVGEIEKLVGNVRKFACRRRNSRTQFLGDFAVLNFRQLFLGNFQQLERRVSFFRGKAAVSAPEKLGVFRACPSRFQFLFKLLRLAFFKLQRLQIGNCCR